MNITELFKDHKCDRLVDIPFTFIRHADMENYVIGNPTIEIEVGCKHCDTQLGSLSYADAEELMCHAIEYGVNW